MRRFVFILTALSLLSGSVSADAPPCESADCFFTGSYNYPSESASYLSDVVPSASDSASNPSESASYSSDAAPSSSDSAPDPSDSSLYSTISASGSSVSASPTTDTPSQPSDGSPSGVPSGRIWARHSPRLDASDVSVSSVLIKARNVLTPENQAGVILGATMQAIIACNENWVHTQRIKIDSGNPSFKVWGVVDKKDEFYPIELSKITTTNYSETAIWPEAWAYAIKGRGYRTYDDGKLLPLSPTNSLQVLTGIEAENLWGSTRPESAEALWLNHLAPHQYLRRPLLLITKNEDVRSDLKKNYAYNVVAYNAQYMWLSDPASEAWSQGAKVYLIGDIFPYIEDFFRTKSDLKVE